MKRTLRSELQAAEERHGCPMDAVLSVGSDNRLFISAWVEAAPDAASDPTKLCFYPRCRQVTPE
jgi:hypothetical protein